MIQQKIKGIKTIIERCLYQIKNPYLSCSFGKDSIVLLYFVKQFIKNIPVVYINSGYSFPDIYDFRDKIIKEWNINYYEIKQEIDYIELCKQIGLPHERTISQQNKVVKILKKDKLTEFAIKNNYDSVFWGIRSNESKKREWLIKKNRYCFLDKNNIYKCSPLAYIANTEIWQIIDLLKIPYCELYNKNKFFKRIDIRNSGWVSTDNAENGKILHIRYYYPELYQKLEKEFPQIRRYI